MLFRKKKHKHVNVIAVENGIHRSDMKYNLKKGGGSFRAIM